MGMSASYMVSFIVLIFTARPWLLPGKTGNNEHTKKVHNLIQ